MDFSFELNYALSVLFVTIFTVLFAWSVSDQAGADISNRYHTIYDSEQKTELGT